MQEIFEHKYYQLLENDDIICTEAVKEVKKSDKQLDKWAKEQGIDDETRDKAKTASALRIISSALGYDTSHWMDPNGVLPHALLPGTELARAHSCGSLVSKWLDAWCMLSHVALDSGLDAELMLHTRHRCCGCWAQSHVRCLAMQGQIQRIIR